MKQSTKDELTSATHGGHEGLVGYIVAKLFNKIRHALKKPQSSLGYSWERLLSIT